MEKNIERILVAVKDGKQFAEMIADYLPGSWDKDYSLEVIEKGRDLKLELEEVKHGNSTNVAAVIVDSSESFEKNHIIGQYVGKISLPIFLFGEFGDIPGSAQNVTYLSIDRPYDMIGKINDVLAKRKEEQIKVLRDSDTKQQI